MILVFADIQAVFDRDGGFYRFSYHGSGLRWLEDDFLPVAKVSRDKLGKGIREMLEGRGGRIISSDLPTPVAIDGDVYARSAAPYSMSAEECWDAVSGTDASAAVISSSLLAHNPSGSAVADTAGFLTSVKRIAVDASDGIFIASQAFLEQRVKELRLSGKEVLVSADEDEICAFLRA